MRYDLNPLALFVWLLLIPALPLRAQVTLTQDRIGIGNANPDERLVIGENLDGISFGLVPAMTIGNSSGGVLVVGNTQHYLGLSSYNGRATLASISADGTRQREVAIQAMDGLAIGTIPGSPDGYMVKVRHNNYGLLLERYETTHDWELYTNTDGRLQLFYSGGYRGVFDSATGAYTIASDRRLKRGIAGLEPVLERVMQLEPSRYRYAAGGKDSRQAIGFIAQDVEPLFPEVVYVSEGERTDGTYTLDYAGFGPIAIKAIQELKREVDAKDARIVELEDRLARIEKLLTEGQTAQNYLNLTDGSAIPKPAVLLQNRPNPFQSVTTITYTIPEQVHHAQLRIADTNGKLLRSMDIGQRGEVQTVLDAGDLPAGAYYYSLWIDGEMIGSKKMILSR